MVYSKITMDEFKGKLVAALVEKAECLIPDFYNLFIDTISKLNIEYSMNIGFDVVTFNLQDYGIDNPNIIEFSTIDDFNFIGFVTSHETGLPVYVILYYSDGVQSFTPTYGNNICLDHNQPWGICGCDPGDMAIDFDFDMIEDVIRSEFSLTPRVQSDILIRDKYKDIITRDLINTARKLHIEINTYGKHVVYEDELERDNRAKYNNICAEVCRRGYTMIRSVDFIIIKKSAKSA